MWSWVFLCPQTPASTEWSFYLPLELILFCVYLDSEYIFPLHDERIHIWQSEWANHSPHALVNAPKAFANSPTFSRVSQTSVYEPLKLFLKIISSYHNRLADSSLLFSIFINEAAIVIFCSQIIHSHYTCRVKWMVFHKEEESPCTAAGLGNKVHRNTLLKHIAMLRDRKLAIHHARLTSMLCCPTATLAPGVCTHTPFCAFSALWFTAVFIWDVVLHYRVSGAAINCSWLPMDADYLFESRRIWSYLSSQTPFFFHSVVLKVRESPAKLLQLFLHFLDFSGLKIDRLTSFEAEDTHLSHWRQADIFFFLSLSLGCTTSKLHLSAVKLLGFGSISFNVLPLETEAARTNHDCFQTGN